MDRMRKELLHMSGLSAALHGGRRLTDLSFTIFSGETHVLLSTYTYNHCNFCDLLCGDILSYTGEYTILNKPLQSIRRLEKIVQVVGLDPIIIPSLSVAENVALCSLSPRWFVKPSAINQCLALMKEIGVTLDITKPISRLTQDEVKIVELLRICANQPPIVVFFDAINYLNIEAHGLTPRVIRYLRQHGCGIVYMTSSFEEALELGDRISILDSDTIRGTFQAEEVRRNPGEIAHLLSGWQPLADSGSDGEDRSMREAIANIGSLVESDGELKRMLCHIAKDLCTALSAHCVIVYLIDETHLNVIDIISSEENAAHTPLLPHAEVLRLLQSDGKQIFQQEDAQQPALRQPDDTIATNVYDPVRLDGKKSVLIHLAFSSRRETDQQLSVYLKVFAREIAMAVETSRLLGNSVLLRETHHRIKNNLQMVHNLLYLQKIDVQTSTQPVDVCEILDMAMRRIKCIASVHSLLCRDWYGRNVANLKTLITEILQLYQDMPYRLTTALEEVSTFYNDAISIALVTNELVSNCVRHAFPADWANPEIFVGLQNTGTDIILTIRDNGIGLADGIDPRQSQSVGMSIVQSISSDLQGEVLYRPVQPSGTEVCVQFPRQSVHPLVSMDERLS